MPNTLLELLQASTQKRSAASALLDIHGRAVSYRSLQTQISMFCKQLYALGLGREARVALVFPDGLEMAVAFLGAACTGTAAPLNPNYRADEFRFYLEDLQADTVILLSGSQSPVRAVAVELDIPILEMVEVSGETGGWQLIGKTSRNSVAPGPLQDDDIALILHTSGTTSRPKMVPLRQRNLSASAQNIVNTLRLTHLDCCLNVMPMFHIHGLMAGLLAPLLAGGSVVCTPGFNIEGFFPWLDRYRPTYYTAVPTMHQAVLAGVESTREIIQRQPLRFIRSSSASLPPTVLAALEAAFQVPVIESYGMTEATHQMASNPLPPLPRKPGSVGQAAGPQIAILDPAGEPLPAGEKGEIAIRGNNVMDGYLNNPDADRSAFTKNWFRTGDEGFLDAEDYLFITGRLKEMINRGGVKVTPQEVDEVFLEHPAVAQAVTFALPHPTLGEDVATAIVLKNSVSISERELRNYALSHLSDQKAPSRVVILDKIPKGPTGKLQRIGLHHRLADQLKADRVAPRNEIEAALVKMVEQLLKVEPVGVLDNFFSLGGDSLLAASLIVQVQTVFQIELPLGIIFRETTVAELAAYLQARKDQGPSTPGKSGPDQDTLDYLSQFG